MNIQNVQRITFKAARPSRFTRYFVVPLSIATVALSGCGRPAESTNKNYQQPTSRPNAASNIIKETPKPTPTPEIQKYLDLIPENRALQGLNGRGAENVNRNVLENWPGQ